MQKNKLILSGKEMVFYYINEMHNVNQWRKPISFAYYKINFFLEIDAVIKINDTVYAPGKYDILAYPLHSNHYGVIDRKQNIEYFEFLIPEQFFSCIDPEGNLERMLCEITQKKAFAVPPAHRERFAQKMHALRELLRQEEGTARILYALLEILFDLKNYSGSPAQMATKILSPGLTAIIDHMEANFTALGSGKELADELHLSRAYIAQLFRQEIGCTPYEYLTDMKIEHSIKLLREGKNVTEACYGAGFNSCSVYIQVFKKKLAQTPHQYKKSL